MIKNFFFDLGNVLLDIDPQRTLDQLSKLIACDAPFSPSDLFGTGANKLVADYQEGTITSDLFFESIRSLCRPHTTTQQIIEAWDAMLIRIPPTRVEAIRRLRDKGHNVYILSNINEEHLRWARNHFDEVGLTFGKDINTAFFSNEMHLAKPDLRIFSQAIRTSRVNPSETLYIDDQQKNIDAGAKMGFHVLCAVRDQWLEPIKLIMDNSRTLES